MSAFKGEAVTAPLIMGVDIARQGADQTAHRKRFPRQRE
jgi:hypothetical protein